MSRVGIWHLCWRVVKILFQERDQCPNGLSALRRMAEWLAEIHLIAIRATFMKSPNISRIFQFPNNMQNGSLGDSDDRSNVAGGHLMVMRDKEEYLRVIG